jgi:hypothetical protein
MPSPEFGPLDPAFDFDETGTSAPPAGYVNSYIKGAR